MAGAKDALTEEQLHAEEQRPTLAAGQAPAEVAKRDFPLPPAEADMPTSEEDLSDRAKARIAEAKAYLAGEEPVTDPPVYDDRGNVRPRGTEGARPMTFEERVEIAARIGSNPDLAAKAERRTGRRS